MIDFWGVRSPQNVDLLDPKSGLFELHPLNPLTNTPFSAHFVAKSGPFGKLGGVGASHPRIPLATGLTATSIDLSDFYDSATGQCVACCTIIIFIQQNQEAPSRDFFC